MSTSYTDIAKNAALPPGKLIIAIPWHRSNNINLSPIEKDSVKLFGTSQINFHAALAYDASQALVEGLRRTNGNFNRAALYSALNDPTFSAEGAKAKVEFNQLHDRKVDDTNKNQLIFLVTPKREPDGNYNFMRVEETK
ncbi:MAG: hypothetical protein ACSI46_01190 [Gloeotrichia echinulata DVL01]